MYLCVGDHNVYPLPTYQKDANVIMILEGSYNHLANSAGMPWDEIESGPVKTGPTGVVDIPLPH